MGWKIFKKVNETEKFKMGRFVTTRLVLILALATSVAMAEQAKVSDSEYEFDVHLDRSKKEIQLSTLRAKQGTLPGEMTLKLYNDKKWGQAIVLKTMDPQAAFPTYMGQLSKNPPSYVGFELRFETNMKALKVLKAFPKAPNVQPSQK